MDDLRERALSQRLRFPASKVAQLTGFANFGAGEEFLEVVQGLLFQDLHDLLLNDAALLGLQVVDPRAELENAVAAMSSPARLKVAAVREKAKKAKLASETQALRKKLRETVQKELSMKNPALAKQLVSQLSSPWPPSSSDLLIRPLLLRGVLLLSCPSS